MGCYITCLAGADAIPRYATICYVTAHFDIALADIPVESSPRDSKNPLQSPPASSAPAGPGVAPFSRLGVILDRAFNSYARQWSAWPVPVLVCGLIALGSNMVCCLLCPLAVGPLICSLFWCAFLNLRGWPVDTASLGRGWQLFWPAMLGGIFLMLLYTIPLFVMTAVMFAGFAFFGLPLLPNPPAAQPNLAAVVPSILSMLSMLVWGPLVFLANLWVFWISTRTMFVMPLIADRGCDFSAAVEASWEATRRRFWERLLLAFLAYILGGAGVYLCYVGVLFTLPLQFLIVAAAYEDEFGIAGLPSAPVSPGGSGEPPFQAGAPRSAPADKAAPDLR
jgi:hypothetical protein